MTGVASTLPEGSTPTQAETDLAFARVRAAGASFVRVTLDWSTIAPTQPSASSDQANPGNPAYRWSSFDTQIKALAAHGLEPVVAVFRAPPWARARARNDPASPPKIKEWRAFVTAAARRYRGGFEGLPRIRYWEAWVEPNLQNQLSPQLVNRVPYAPVVYRSMVNAMAAALNAVSANDRLVIGGLGPFRDSTQAVVDQDSDWGPLSFMRALFCLSSTLAVTCHDPVHADIWDVHPYTSGGPGHHALLENDASLGDFDKLKVVLIAARLAKNLVAPHGLGLWVTEFSWDSSPPDPNGVPMPILSRWVPQALYEMWEAGVTRVAWLALRDEPFPSSPYQSGLYFRSGSLAHDTAKPFLQGFRFPFVAFPSNGSIEVWGRTPTSSAGKVSIELDVNSKWHRVAVVSANGVGIFTAHLKLSNTTSSMRARFGDESSLGFGLQAVPDRFVNPFGTVPPLETR